MKRIVRDKWKERHGLDKDAEYVTYQPAEEEVVSAYVTGGTAPTPESPLYFGPNYSSHPWNRRIIEMLRDITVPYIQEEHCQLPLVGDSYVEHLFCERLKAVAGLYNSCQPKYKQDETRLESPEEAHRRSVDQATRQHAAKTGNSVRTRVSQILNALTQSTDPFFGRNSRLETMLSTPCSPSRVQQMRTILQHGGNGNGAWTRWERKVNQTRKRTTPS